MKSTDPKQVRALATHEDTSRQSASKASNTSAMGALSFKQVALDRYHSAKQVCALSEIPASSSKDALQPQDVYHIVDHYGHFSLYPLSL